VALAVSAAAPKSDQFVAQLQEALVGTAPALQGTQVVADKFIADGRLEVLVKIDVLAPPGVESSLPPPYNILSMVREEKRVEAGRTASGLLAEPAEDRPDQDLCTVTGRRTKIRPAEETSAARVYSCGYTRMRS
jgi:hypothetical protein